MTDCPGRLPICSHGTGCIIDLGHSLGLTVLAEGVETAETLTHLRTFDCDVVQEYFICCPMPAATFDAWRASYPTSTMLRPEEPAPAE